MLLISTAFAVGIVMQHYAHISIMFCACGIIFILMLLSLRMGEVFKSGLIILLFVALGMIYVTSYGSFQKNHISTIARFYRGKPVSVRGEIVSAVKQRNFFNHKKTEFFLNIEKVKSPWGWKERSGKILVHIFDDVLLQYGQSIELTGKLHRPFNFSDSKFSYRDYLEYQQVKYILSVKRINPPVVLEEGGNVLRKTLLRFRKNCGVILDDYLTENESGIIKAIILGERTHIPKHVRELFVQTGTVHVLAISGLHIGIVLALIMTLLKIFPIRRGVYYLLAVMLLLVYTFMTGMRPSIIRATVMATILLLSHVFERDADSLNTLGLAAFVLTSR